MVEPMSLHTVNRLVATRAAPAAITHPRDHHIYPRDNENGDLSAGEIITLVGIVLGLIIGLPGLIALSIQARKCWQRYVGGGVRSH